MIIKGIYHHWLKKTGTCLSKDTNIFTFFVSFQTSFTAHYHKIYIVMAAVNKVSYYYHIHRVIYGTYSQETVFQAKRIMINPIETNRTCTELG